MKLFLYRVQTGCVFLIVSSSDPFRRPGPNNSPENKNNMATIQAKHQSWSLFLVIIFSHDSERYISSRLRWTVFYIYGIVHKCAQVSFMLNFQQMGQQMSGPDSSNG